MVNYSEVILHVKMKKIITFSLVMILLIGLASSEIISNEKPSLTKDLEQKSIEKENKTKLINTYGKQFEEIKKFNSYKQQGDITIINVTIKDGKVESYARIITNTNKFNEVLK